MYSTEKGGVLMKQKQYAKVIREKRKALGWTQKELAKKIFSTQQAVTEPNLDSLTALSRALGTPVSHFLDNVDIDYEEEFLALYRSLSTEDAIRTIDYMKLLKRQENERNQLLKD